MPEGSKRLAEYDPVIQELAELTVSAEGGDATALAELKTRFGASPDVWTGYEELAVDLASRAESALLAIIAGDKLMTREAIKHKLAQMRVELAGPKPTILARLLAERIVICWLRVQAAEVAASRSGVSLIQAEYDQKTLDRAHKRYLAAIKTLATVQRAELPALQVNIAEKQVNLVR